MPANGSLERTLSHFMGNETKRHFIRELSKRFGSLRKLDRSQSLFEIGDGLARVLIRYSRVHERNQTFYGLRKEDLAKLEGHPSLICFLWNGQAEPLLVPFLEYEEVFESTSPAQDGQYKVQVYFQEGVTELYIAQAGRFNVEAHFGWSVLDALIDSANLVNIPEFSHSGVQTIIGAIGVAKNYDVWIPPADRAKLEWSIADPFEFRDVLPYAFEPVKTILQEVDVIWAKKGSSDVKALFEIEHTTPIYTGLLRFNDIYLVAPSDLRPRFTVVASEARRALFIRQLNRPTFQTSGLSKLCTFLDYSNVFTWFNRVKRFSDYNQ